MKTLTVYEVGGYVVGGVNVIVCRRFVFGPENIKIFGKKKQKLQRTPGVETSVARAILTR